MKVQIQILFLCSCFALISAKFQVRSKEDALEAHEFCKEDNNIPDDIYEQFLDYQLPEHRRTSCYVKCWVERMGLFTEKKGFDQKNIITQFTHEDPKNLGKVQHGLEKCYDNNEWDSDVCTFALRVYSCWLKVNRNVVKKVLS